MPNAIFIYLQRDPVMLAQSLLIARTEITGNLNHNYRLLREQRCIDDPIEDVCRQVEFYKELELSYVSTAFRKNIVFVKYEEFCARPHELLDELESVLPFKIMTSWRPESEKSQAGHSSCNYDRQFIQ